ncbi:MAG: DUF5684 domain-containing protein [Thermoanaerobaculia bacterium]
MVTVILFAVSLVFYLFFCYCYKRICEKAGVEPGWMIWVPILQLIPMFQAAKLHPALILLFLIPFVNLIMAFVLVANLSKALGRSPMLCLWFRSSASS